MVKFSKVLEAQIIPEWREKFVNYRHLKKQIKRIKLSRVPKQPQDVNGEFGLSIFDPIRYLTNKIYNKFHDPDNKSTDIIQVHIHIYIIHNMQTCRNPYVCMCMYVCIYVCMFVFTTLLLFKEEQPNWSWVNVYVRSIIEFRSLFWVFSGTGFISIRESFFVFVFSYPKSRVCFWFLSFCVSTCILFLNYFKKLYNSWRHFLAKLSWVFPVHLNSLSLSQRRQDMAYLLFTKHRSCSMTIIFSALILQYCNYCLSNTRRRKNGRQSRMLWEYSN